MTLQAQCHLFGWRSGVLVAMAPAQQCMGQNGGVFGLTALETIEDVFDAVAGVFEFSVEGFVMVMAMILQAL